MSDKEAALLRLQATQFRDSMDEQSVTIQRSVIQYAAVQAPEFPDAAARNG